MFCRQCGTKLEKSAKFCEQCGAAVAQAPATGAGGGPSIPSWLYAMLPALLIIGLAVGFVVGYFVAPEGEDSVMHVTTTASTLVSATSESLLDTTSTLPATTTLVPSTTVTSVSTTFTLPSTTTTKPPTTTTWPDYVMEWPMSKSGWTVQVAKFDGANPESEGWAQDLAEAVLADRLPAGVLYSTNFSSIQEGWYVVFSGVFNTKTAAQSHRTKVLAKGYGEAVVIQVVPK